MDPWESWFIDAAVDGSFRDGAGCPVVEWEDDNTTLEVSADKLRGVFQEAMDRHGTSAKRKGSANAFGHLVRDMIPGVKDERPRVGGKLTRIYILPSLNSIRKAYVERYRMSPEFFGLDESDPTK